ncbi:MAG TPA: serine/threonine-protein kinase [Kofleriaceae bacterium]|nr:serine/threonine-protein kinase [Kofleriaceae bacterium]
MEENTDLTPADSPLVAGTDVGGYAIDGVLGRGGMGIVYSATHPLIGKRAAIKVLLPLLSKDQRAVERFVLEARAVNQIGHPNIVDIFAFGVLPDGRSYYVMDLLVGEPLRARLQRGPLHISEASSVIAEIASALVAAHGKGIIHRDLKPDNVFLVTMPDRWPEVRLLDWGLAKLAANPAKLRTLAGQVLGTPVYMSPEQAAAGEVDHRTDIYALGVMAYELLAGDVPFKRTTSIDTMVAHTVDPVPPLARRAPTVPEELAQLVEAMLAKAPDDRPTLAAVQAVLRRLRGSQIPTMTAAGLQMVPAPPTAPYVIPVDQLSQELTAPRTPQARGSLPAIPSTTPGYSIPHIKTAQGSIPPPVRGTTAVVPGRRRRSILVILLVALVGIAIGIAVTLLV